MASGKQMGGVGRNAESQKSADRAAADRNRAAAVGGINQYAGYRGPAGTSNPDTANPPGSYGLSSAETKQYNSAKDEYAKRDFMQRAFDFLSPVHSINPQINQPSSWMGGTTHYGVNPGGLFGGLLGGALFPGAGLVTGPIGSKMYDQTGMHELVLSGPGYKGSTSYPDGGPGYNSSTGYGGPAGGPSSPQGKGDQSGLQHLQTLAQINQGISGNQSAPQPVNGASQLATPQYANMMASNRNITPNYNVSLPGYRYTATV
jgi:hypothetical protein